MNEESKAALLGDIDEALDNLGPNRPSAPKVTRARTLLKGIKVACQTIAISPVTDGGVSAPPPTPGPETPPVEPAPPETPPSGGGGGGSTSPPTTTTVVTTYTSQGDFNGTQGYRGWYYLEEDETPMTYSAGSLIWNGGETYQGIWATGQHPGGTHGAMRRWVAQGTGTFAITGQAFDSDTAGGSGNNVTVTVLKNGAAIYGPQTITAGDATGYTLNLTGNCAANDEFDFLVKGVSGISFASTGLTVSISLTTTTTTGGGSTTQTTLPFTLNGTAPEEGTYTLTANKPSNADGCTIDITGVNLAATYGRVYFNGSTNSLPIWATNPSNAGVSATVSLAVPVAYLVNGSNTLRFTHDTGSGYTVTAIGTPAFTTASTPTPPATQTSLPFDLRGSILPEDAILTVSLSKPSNATGAAMNVTGVNLTGEMGAYYINGTLASAIWETNAANAGVSATVTRTPAVSLFVNGNNTIRFTHTSGSGYTVSGVQVTFTTPSPGTDPGPPAGNNGAFQNEPSGMTTILNWPFNTIVGPNMENNYNGGAIRSDSTAPLSPSSCLVARLEAFAREGGNELHAYSPTVYRELFMGVWWRTNAAFQGRIVANKMFFLRGPASNGVIVFNNGRLSGGTGQLLFSVNGGASNQHILGPSSDSGSFFPANVGNGTMVAGVWTKLEWRMRASTTITSQDGILQLWINGVLTHNHTNLNYSNGVGLNEWVMSQTWDGSGDMGTSNTVAWEHWVDHLYLSGRN